MPNPDQSASEYLERKQVTQIFESILTGLTVHKPEDPISYMEDCLGKIRAERDTGKGIEWDVFVRNSKMKDHPSSQQQQQHQQQQHHQPAQVPQIGHPGPGPKRAGAGVHHIEPINKTPALRSNATAAPILPQVQAKGILPRPAQLPNKKQPASAVAAKPPVGSPQPVSEVAAEEAGKDAGDGGDIPNAHSRLPAIHSKEPVHSPSEQKSQTQGSMAKPKLVPGIPQGSSTVDSETPAIAIHTDSQGDSESVKLPSDNVVFVLGGPGCGKGTNCVRLAKEFDYAHLSAGDLLRAEVNTGSDLGKELDGLMKEGKIVPMNVTLNLLKKAMMGVQTTKGYLIDGFPRQMDQAIEFEKQIIPCKFVLFFDCPESLMEQRLIKRGETSGRSDDNAETIRKRFRTFLETSMPVIEYFETTGRVKKVSSAMTVDEVYDAARGFFLDEPEAGDKKVAEEVTAVAKATPESEHLELPSKNIYFVLGGPGCGKGTNCVRLAAEFGLKHLSSGDLLRAEVATGSDLGKELEVTMREGAMVSLDITLRLLKHAMLSSGPTNGYLVDGFPRKMDQAMEFEKQIAPPTKIIYFECSEELMLQRLLKRGETSGRADDNADTIKKRFANFLEQSLPVVEHYRKSGKLVTVSSASPVDEVYSAAREPFVAVSTSAITPGDEAEKLDSGINSTSEVAVAEPAGQKKLADKVDVVFVLGGPGSGKGTQCDRIVHNLGFAHLSTGDLLRAEVAKKTEMGLMLESVMTEGKMVSMDLTLQLLTDAMHAALASDPAPRGFLIDGFPRTLEQAEAFEKSIGRGRFSLFFSCPNDVLVQRLLTRGQTSGRADDNMESIKKRIDTFMEMSLPVADYFKLDGRLKEINSEGAVDEITTMTIKAFADEGIKQTDAE